MHDINPLQYRSTHANLDAINLDSLNELLSDDADTLQGTINTLEDVSSFAAILSPKMMTPMPNFAAPLTVDTVTTHVNDNFQFFTNYDNDSPSASSISSGESPRQSRRKEPLGRNRRKSLKKLNSPISINKTYKKVVRSLSDDHIAEGDIFGEGSNVDLAQMATTVINSKSGLPVRTGRWTPEEHRKFLQGIAQNGRNWDKVAQNVLTRTTVQVRSHAQKYFKKLAHQEMLKLHSRGAYQSFPSTEIGDADFMEFVSDEMLMDHVTHDMETLVES